MEQWTGGGGGDGEMALTSDPELSSSVPNLIVQECTNVLIIHRKKQ